MYLYISEDNNFSTRTGEPTADDMDSIDAGVLTVVRFHAGRFEWLEADGSWTPIAPAER